MLGSGGMARVHLEALLAVRPLERVQVYSPTRTNRERYAAEMGERFGLEVVAVDEPRDAFRGADVVMAAPTPRPTWSSATGWSRART